MAATPESSKTKSAKVRSAKKVKVPKNHDQISVVVLECGNCGAEDEKVFFCAECDSPMRVVEVVEKEAEYVEENDMISKDTAGEEETEIEEEEVDSGELKDELGLSGGDGSVDDMIESGGLGDIFSGGESGEMDLPGGDEEPANLDDIVSALDDE